MICLMWTTILVWDRVGKSCILVWNRTDLLDRVRKMLGDRYVTFSGGHIMWQKCLLLIYVADYVMSVISLVTINHRKLKVIGFATKSEHLRDSAWRFKDNLAEFSLELAYQFVILVQIVQCFCYLLWNFLWVMLSDVIWDQSWKITPLYNVSVSPNRVRVWVESPYLWVPLEVSRGH